MEHRLPSRETVSQPRRQIADGSVEGTGTCFLRSVRIAESAQFRLDTGRVEMVPGPATRKCRKRQFERIAQSSHSRAKKAGLHLLRRQHGLAEQAFLDLCSGGGEPFFPMSQFPSPLEAFQPGDRIIVADGSERLQGGVRCGIIVLCQHNV